MKMKRLITYLSFFFCSIPLTLWAQDDIEVTDSTSTEWNTEEGGGLTPTTPTGPVTSMSISQTELTMEGGEKARLYATLNTDATNKNVTWTSSNDAVAAVYPTGLVRALSQGTAVITATAAGNTTISRTCVVTVTSDYNGLSLPDVSFEFCYNAEDFDATTNTIPNHPGANLEDYALQLSGNIPAYIDGTILRINSRCEGYINRWEKGAVESGDYFNRTMTMVAMIAPRMNTDNTSDFISNRVGGSYHFMWRIGDHNASFLHTGQSYEPGRALFLNTEEPQILAIRIHNDEIILDNLTTSERSVVGGVWWGQGENTAFKIFYNDDNEFFTGDFYWVYYSFEYLTDEQLNVFKETTMISGDANGDGNVSIADVTAIINKINGNPPASFNEAAADVNGDGKISIADVTGIINIINQ